MWFRKSCSGTFLKGLKETKKDAMTAFIQTDGFPKTSLECHRYTSLPGKLIRPLCILQIISLFRGARSSVVGWDTMLQAGKSRVRVKMRTIIFFFNLPNPSCRTRPDTEISTRDRKKCFCIEERGRRVRVTTSRPSVSRLSTQCGILNISHPYRVPRPVTGIDLFFLFFLTLKHKVSH
jgi:hypothetical protein